MRFQITLCSGVVVLLLTAMFGRAVAAEPSFSVLPGLEAAVAFWKQIFARYGAGDVVFFDPFDHGKIYSVLRAPKRKQVVRWLRGNGHEFLPITICGRMTGDCEASAVSRNNLFPVSGSPGATWLRCEKSFAMRACRWSSPICLSLNLPSTCALVPPPVRLVCGSLCRTPGESFFTSPIASTSGVIPWCLHAPPPVC